MVLAEPYNECVAFEPLGPRGSVDPAQGRNPLAERRTHSRVGIRFAGWVALAALVVFCIVQDRETASGVGRYVSAQTAALAGRGPRVTVDEIMRPAIRTSVRRGLEWSGLVSALGFGAAIALRRSRRG